MKKSGMSLPPNIIFDLKVRYINLLPPRIVYWQVLPLQDNIPILVIGSAM